MTDQAPPPPPKSEQASVGEVELDTEVVSEPPLLSVWYGILIAVGCFPIVLTLLVSTLIFGLLKAMGNPISILLVIITCMALVAMMSLPAYLLTRLLSLGLGGIFSDRGAIGIYGGMTGFLSTTGGGLAFTAGPPSVRQEEDLAFLLVTTLAILMGYLGAIGACYWNRKTSIDFFEPILSREKQITISFLMKLTAIIAVLAVILKTMGNAALYMGSGWTFYFVLQACLLFCDHWITGRFSHRSAIQAASQN